MIFHHCHVKCLECLKSGPGCHMDDVEKCSKKCQLLNGSWEHDLSCKHWVVCDLCTAKVVCATLLHMRLVHGCKLKERGCGKEGKTWKHGETCSAVWCSEYEARKAFGQSEFRKHMKAHNCSCKVMKPSQGYKESCPCYKKCPVKKGCVVAQSSIREHVRRCTRITISRECKKWKSKSYLHMRYEHGCKCSKPLNEVHDEGCPCFLTCPFCKTSVAWDHMME